MGNQSYDRPTKKPKLTYYHEQTGTLQILTALIL